MFMRSTENIRVVCLGLKLARGKFSDQILTAIIGEQCFNNLDLCY